jgi:hypothetical protein
MLNAATVTGAASREERIRHLSQICMEIGIAWINSMSQTTKATIWRIPSICSRRK